MTSGSAYGVDRQYQEQARDILVRMSATPLGPYSGDGIDVRIPLGSALRTFDVALRDPAGRIVVAESRRRRSKVKLADLDAFARRVELLAKETGLPVAGVYFTKSAYQLGAVKAGGDAKIQVAVCAQDQPTRAFALTFEHYDSERARRTRDGRVMINSGLMIRGELGTAVARAEPPDPSTER
jgi:hypothetical protein